MPYKVRMAADATTITTKQASFRLTDYDFSLIDEAQRELQLPTRTEALRSILRQWAECRKAASGRRGSK